MADTQRVSLRLPVDLVEFVDDRVRTGRAASRSEVVRRALQRERQRVVDERDLAIYADLAKHPDPELEAWRRYASGHLPEVMADLDDQHSVGR